MGSDRLGCSDMSSLLDSDKANAGPVFADPYFFF
jgi:hypothetical protein